MIRNLFGGDNDLGGDNKCRSVDVCDIFGDGSGKALYRFDGNANDESGNYHGTETNVTYGGGQYGRSAIVTAGKITINSSSSVLLPYNADYSVSSWIGKTPSGTYAAPYSRDNSASSRGDNAYLTFTTNKLSVQIALTSNNTSTYTTTNMVWTDFDLHHVVIIVARSISSIIIYVDGVLFETFEMTTSISFNNSVTSTYIGGSDNAVYHGKYDQVRFFNRALTESEVQALSQELKPTSILDSVDPFEDGSLKAKFQFNSSPKDLLNAYNGTETAGCAYIAGKYGNSLLVRNGKLTYGGESKNLMPSTGNYSVSCWMRKIAGVRNVIAARHYSSSACGETFHMEPTGAFVYGTPSSATATNNNVSPAQTILDDDNFHHVALIVNRTALKSYIYIDGKLFYTGISLASPYDNNLGTLSGALHSANYYGHFDQMQFYNKALTPMEVAALYTETTPLEEPLSIQVDPFKDGSGKSLYRFEGNSLDESGNYNGTPTGVAYVASNLGGRGILFSNARTPSAPTAYVRFSTLLLTDFTYTFWLAKSVTGTHEVAGKFVTSLTNHISISTTMSFRVNSLLYISSASFTDDTNMHFYSISRQGSTLKFYRDGVYLDSKTVSTDASDIDVIGCVSSASSPSNTTGTVNQFRKFNRALTDAEITQLYNAGA